MIRYHIIISSLSGFVGLVSLDRQFDLYNINFTTKIYLEIYHLIFSNDMYDMLHATTCLYASILCQ
jgi:hypothetical protein